MDFPIFKTKSDVYKKFDLTNASERREYFGYKAGPEIKKLQDYLKNNTFIIYLLGKKNSGKGVYSKMFKEIVSPDKVEHFSIGDMIRGFDDVLKDGLKKKELVDFLHKKYRGPVSVEEIIKSMEDRSTKTLLPTELILALTEKEISKMGRKAIFIDGFPRDFDQVSYSLFFKSLIAYREDPDFFVLIDVPMNVIDERIKYRVVCPLCNTSRNTKLLATSKVEYDSKENKFYLICDNPDCPGRFATEDPRQSRDRGSKMALKEGDELGIEPIRERLDKEGKLMEKIYRMHGISKILLRNAIPKSEGFDSYDDYEITPEYVYSLGSDDKGVEIKERPWEVKDDDGVVSNSLMPPPVVVSLIKQLAKALNL